MNEYMNKELFLAYMGLTGDETKYGNRDAEHQHRSYSTYMSYEIMDCVDDSIVEEELAPVVRCKDCKHFFGGCICEMHSDKTLPFGFDVVMNGDDFCSYGERKDGKTD